MRFLILKETYLNKPEHWLYLIPRNELEQMCLEYIKVCITSLSLSHTFS